MTFWSWSKTAATNATADSTINWAEGQAPSSINDSARAMMTAAAKYRDDISGAIVTGGTSTAYTVTSYEVFDTLAHLNGQMIAFTPHAANGATATLNVDGLGAKPLRLSPNVELQSNVLIQGTPYVAIYNNSDGAFYIHNLASNTYGIPLGGGMDFWLPTAPSSAFVFPTGQAISRTTYATLFAAMGTTFGAGDGSTTFNLPDKTGRVSAMRESSQTRLTTSYFGASGATLGAVGGGESQSLTQPQLPPVALTFSGGAATINSLSSGSSYLQAAITANTFLYGTGGSGGILLQGGSGSISQVASSASYTPSGSIITTGGSSVLNGGGATLPHPIVQPTIVCNYILRII